MTNLSPELDALLAEMPELSIKRIELPAPTIINNLIDGLNFAATADKSEAGIDKQMDVVILHTFDKLDMDKLSECFDYLAYINLSRLNRRAYRKLLESIPTKYSQYKRIKGNFMFELCRHMTYDKATELLGIKNV